MAQAARSLSPKQILERMQRHRHAVAVLALMQAKKAVQTQIRAKGQRISDYSVKEISRLAEAELQRNRDSLIADAEHAIATWPGFARWRLPCANLESAAQTEKPPISTTSTLQISGA
jgi:hypothetical protein